MENDRRSAKMSAGDEYPFHHHDNETTCPSEVVTASRRSLDTVDDDDDDDDDDLTVESQPNELYEEDTRSVIRLSYTTCKITKRTKRKLPSFDPIPKPNKRKMKEKREKRQMLVALTGTVSGFVLAGPLGAIAIGMGGAYAVKKMHVIKERRAIRKYSRGDIMLKKLKAKDGVLV